MTPLAGAAAADLEVVEIGSGSPLLLLHGWLGGEQSSPLIEQLSSQFEVLAPSHPGFGESTRPQWMDSVDDLAYLYLDLLAERDLRDVTVVGVSLGGWVAAEMAVRTTERMSRLVLVDAIGIRVGDVDDCGITDIFAISREELARRVFHDPSLAVTDFANASADAVQRMTKNEEAATLFVWKPYMHNPKLRHWLHRVDVPTLVVWGEDDGIVSADYGRAYADAIPGAAFETIAAAAHAPDAEQPTQLAELICRFAAHNGGAGS